MIDSGDSGRALAGRTSFVPMVALKVTTRMASGTVEALFAPLFMELWAEHPASAMFVLIWGIAILASLETLLSLLDD